MNMRKLEEIRKNVLSEMEKEFIISALKANNGRINQTVAQANIPKNTLLRKIRKYGINVKDYTSEE